jgi:hypothetical protein
MNIALWIVTGLLAVAYLAGGVTMLALSKAKYRSIAITQHWVDDFSPGAVKAIGAVKVLAAIGLILPAALDIAPVLVPLAALGLVLLMTGATTVRLMRKEWRYAAGDLIFITLATFVAWGRFGPASF